MVFGVKNAYFLSKSKKKMPNEGSYYILANFLIWKSKLCALNMGSLVHFLTDITMAFPYVNALLFSWRKSLVWVGLAVVDAEVEDPLLLSLPNKRE